MGLLSYFLYSKVGKLQVYIIKNHNFEKRKHRTLNIGNLMLVLFSKYNLG